MSNLTPDFVSQLIEDQFPEFFKHQNPAIVDFVLAYFEYLEQSGKTTKALRTLKDNRDIDTTIDDFIIHFKKTFLQGAQFQNQTDDRFLIKHVSDLYQSKGTSRSIELLIKLLFGEEVEIFLPSERTLIPSHSKFYKPIYLELSPSDRTRGFIGKEISGSSSGATGFVESVVTKTISQKRVTVAYISNVIGNFETNEYITDDGVIQDAPILVGSLTSITITNGGRNFAVGDLFNVESGAGTGALGQAKITSVQDATGRVSFTIANGGYGYTESNTYTRSLSSNATLVVENVTNSDSNIDDFFQFETVEQPLANVNWTSGNGQFISIAEGIVINGANSTGSLVANGYMVSNNALTNTITIQVSSGDFALADYLYTNSTINVAIDTVTNVTSIGEFLETENRDDGSIVIGINANNQSFYKGNHSFIRGQLSNTYANVANIGLGTAADYEIGTLSNQENLTLFTDIIGANNTAEDPVPMSNVHAEGSNSGIGFVDSITIDTGIGINNRANSGSPFAANGGFAAGQYIFEANLVVNSVAVTATGSGYSNSDTVVFTGGSPDTTAAASLITDSDGSVQAIEISNNGINYEKVPSVTITSSGSGATLAARMKASGNSIGAVAHIKSVNSTMIVARNLSNGSFTNGRTITNEGVNAFANVVNNALLAGTGYINADTISITGGNPNVSATASFSANAANTGSVHSITIVEPGTEYLSNATSTISTSTGSGASISVNMDFGYGFPKSGQADLTTILYNALTFANFTIGTIASLKGINPGAGYNLDPVALAHNPYVAGFNRRDLICNIDNRSGVFTIGENLRQNLSLPGVLILHSNSTSNGITLNANSAAIAAGEGVVQLTSGASGVVESSNATHLKIQDVVGTFDSTNIIQTQTSTANIAPLNTGSVTVTTISAIATGTFKAMTADDGQEAIKIRRLNFGQAFIPGTEIEGLSSGATANVVYAYQDGDTQPIGLNADITADVITANGVAQELEIINSGFGYEEGDVVNLTASNSNFIVAGSAKLGKQGVGEGTWRDRRSFINDVNKIQDSDYYQEYSYVTKTGIALAKYEEQLKEILHVAGTKLFGEVVKVRKVDSLRIASNGVNITTS